MNRQELESYIVDIASRLIEVRTVNYDKTDYPDAGPDGMDSPGMEYKAAEIVKAEFDKYGINYKEFGAETGRPEVVAFIGKGDADHRSLMVAAHMDTVPSGAEPWVESEDPFKAVVKNGLLYGRGSLDNKGQLASIMGAARLLKEREDELTGQVLIAAVSDEEVGGSHGLRDIVKNGDIKPTDAIIPDVGLEMKSIVIAEKGRALVEVQCFGRAAHGSTPYEGVSAISGMAEYVRELDAKGIEFEATELFKDGTTVNAGLFEAGDAPNMVAARAVLTVDIRYVPSLSASEIVSQLEALGEKVAGSMEGISFKVVLRDDTKPMLVDENTPLVKELQGLTDAGLTGIGGGTVSKILNTFGVTSVGFAPGNGKYFHMADERVEIEQLVRFAEVITDIGIKLANHKKD